MEGIEHQQGVLQAIGGNRADGGIVEQFDQRMHVVAAEHGAEQFGRLLAADERTGFLAEGDGSEVTRLDLGRIVHTGGNAVGDQIKQESFFARRRRFQQLDDLGGLLRGKR